MNKEDYTPEKCIEAGRLIKDEPYLLSVLSDARAHLAGRGLMCEAELIEILAAAHNGREEKYGND